MSEIIVMTPEQMESFVERISTKAIDTYINKVASLKEEKLLSLSDTQKFLKIGHSKAKQLVIDGKLRMHSSGKILKSSIDAYLNNN